MSRFQLPKRWTAVLLGAALGLSVLSGCVLLSSGAFQTLNLFFRTTQALAAGETMAIYSSFYPKEVQVRRHFVKVYGRIDVPGGAELPARATAQVVSEDADSGNVYYRFNLTLRLAADGSFEAMKKYKRNIEANTLQTISVAVEGADLPSGTEIAFCMHIAKKRGDLAKGSCGAGSDPGGGDGELHTVRVLDNRFDPQSLTVFPGDTVRWVLEGNDASHTTTAMAGTWDSGFVFVQQGDFFERKFSRSDNNMTFEYSCVTHQACCAMQGSIRVGNNAPDPIDGY